MVAPALTDSTEAWKKNEGAPEDNLGELPDAIHQVLIQLISKADKEYYQ